jgi:hypothetical protein
MFLAFSVPHDFLRAGKQHSRTSVFGFDSPYIYTGLAVWEGRFRIGGFIELKYDTYRVMCYGKTHVEWTDRTSTILQKTSMME